MNKRVLVGSLYVVAAVLLAASALEAGGERTQSPPPREVTMSGKIVDLHCFMTGKFPSADHAKCTRECIRAGVPAALETEDSVVILSGQTLVLTSDVYVDSLKIESGATLDLAGHTITV